LSPNVTHYEKTNIFDKKLKNQVTVEPLLSGCPQLRAPL